MFSITDIKETCQDGHAVQAWDGAARRQLPPWLGGGDRQAPGDGGGQLPGLPQHQQGDHGRHPGERQGQGRLHHTDCCQERQ